MLSLPNFTLTEKKKLEYRVKRTLRTTDKVSVAINPKRGMTKKTVGQDHGGFDKIDYSLVCSFDIT